MLRCVNFREGGKIPTGLAWCSAPQSWICGDSLGSVWQLSGSAESFEELPLIDCAITAITGGHNSRGSSIAVGLIESLHLTEFPNVASSLLQTTVRKTLAINCIQYNTTGSFIMVSSYDPDITVFNVQDGKIDDKKISTNNLGVKTFAMNSADSIVAFVDVNGNLKGHFLSYSEANPLEQGMHRKISRTSLDLDKFGLVDKSVARSQETGCKLSWYPRAGERTLLAVPSKDCVVLLERTGESKWSEEYISVKTGADDSGAILALASFSPNGRYLAAADASGRIFVWSVDLASPSDSTLVRSMAADTPLVDMAWGQEEEDNYLILLSVDGFVKVPDVVDAALPHPVAVALPVPQVAPVAAEHDDHDDHDDSPAKLTHTAHSSAGANNRRRLVRASAIADDDDDNEDGELFASAVTSAAAVAEAPVASADMEVGDDADAVGGEATSIRAIKRTTLGLDDEAHVASGAVVRDDEEEDDFDEDDDEDDVLPQNVDVGDAREALRRYNGRELSVAVPQIVLQPPFQPSCTRPDEKTRRYLVWNHVGAITSRDDDNPGEKRVEIRFSNTIGANKNEYFADRTGFSMAALSFEGAVFASDRVADEEPNRAYGEAEAFRKALPGSTVYYHAFPGQRQLEGANESFRFTLGDGEAALAVAVGLGWVAVATSSQLLRIFSSTGIQTKICWLAGPVVCLVGSDSRLAVVYHGGQPLLDTFQLRVDMYDVSWREGCRCKLAVKSLALPLTRGSSLSWACFDADSLLLTALDSQGVMSMLVKSGAGAWEWVPVLDVNHNKKSVDHVFWPVMVKSEKFVFVLLNGESKPDVHPQPVVGTKPLRLPFATVRDGKDVGEAQREKMQQLLWSDLKHAHCEALRDECALLGGAAFGVDRFAELEAQLEDMARAADTLVLKLFQEACQQQRLAQALNLALKLRTEKALSGAVKVANYFGRTSVATAVDAMLQNKLAAAAEQQQQFTSQEEHGDYHDGSDAMALDGDMGTQRSVGTLSGRVASKSQLPPSGRLGGSSSVVSPPAGAETMVTAMNPFAVRGDSSSASTPVKRKGAFDGLRDLKESPSPAKKPNTLSRQSTFSQNARQQKLSEKTIL